jgi:hypothetical protein
MPSSGISILDAILDNGKVGSLCDCCPCGNYYVAGSVSTFLQFLESTGWNNYSEDCEGSTSAWYTSCCTETCFDKFSEIGTDITNLILEKGYVEYSSLGNKSLLCILYDYVIENNLSEEEAIEIVENILDKGVVFYCNKDQDLEDGNQGNQILASVQTYSMFAEVSPPPCDPENPCSCYPQEKCCLNILAGAEMYAAWIEAFGGGGGPIPA